MMINRSSNKVPLSHHSLLLLTRFDIPSLSWLFEPSHQTISADLIPPTKSLAQFVKADSLSRIKYHWMFKVCWWCGGKRTLSSYTMEDKPRSLATLVNNNNNNNNSRAPCKGMNSFMVRSVFSQGSVPAKKAQRSPSLLGERIKQMLGVEDEEKPDCPPRSRRCLYQSVSSTNLSPPPPPPSSSCSLSNLNSSHGVLFYFQFTAAALATPASRAAN